MNKTINLFCLLLFISVSSTYSQENKLSFGISAGGNISKYILNNPPIDYKFKAGFYVGGFLNIVVDGHTRFQPEILFITQGTKTQTSVAITDINGQPMPRIQPYDFEYNVNEFTIALPLMIQLYLSDGFYFESGPQLGLIVERTISSSQSLLDGTGSEIFTDSYDKFDFGVSLGVGYDFSNKISISLRSYSGLIKRDEGAKSFVIGFGLEYNFIN